MKRQPAWTDPPRFLRAQDSYSACVGFSPNVGSVELFDPTVVTGAGAVVTVLLVVVAGLFIPAEI